MIICFLALLGEKPTIDKLVQSLIQEIDSDIGWLWKISLMD